ncbi:MAG TPA: FUSC family protein [Candidatus Saccharimonadia bacterium]|nr:FUSC family protein [Candidatus Saccharimonadia bacterium]
MAFKSLRKAPLMWTEAFRALLCLTPMLVASGLGKTTYLVALGQGGFFFSALFLPKKTSGRVVMGSLILALGLGFYLIGGSVAPNPVVAVIFTLLVCINLSLLSGWKIGGPLALTLVMIYTSGLNAGSPARASHNFLAFAFVLAWSALISLLPIWKPIPPPPANTDLGNAELGEQGLRMGIGSALALALSYAFGFAKLGWAPSAVGNVVRYEDKLSKKRAWARFYGTLGGAALATIALAFITNVTVVVWIGAVFGVLNGLYKATMLGKMPLFYTATILLLYSANDLSHSGAVTVQRIIYNLVGITIGMVVILYPFPLLMKKLRPQTTLQ